MGRTHPTITLRVRQFEQRWEHLARAPRRVDRAAFAELCAFAHYHAAAISYGATLYLFETMLVAMLIGITRRVQTVQETAGVPDKTSTDQACLSLYQTCGAIFILLRQRVPNAEREWRSFARALRREDREALRYLWALPQHLPVPTTQPPAISEERLLEMMIALVRELGHLEKQQLWIQPHINFER